MFKSYYNLTFNPFDKSIKCNQSFETADYKEMLSRLHFLKDNRGIGLFTSSPGMGKTFAIRCFSETLNPNLFKFIYITLSTVSTLEFYRQLSDSLGLEPYCKKTQLFKSIQENFMHLVQNKKMNIYCVIDEAQYLNTDILKDLKMLMNFSMDSKDYASLVLIGHPTLNDILDKQVHEALKQRIVIHYNFQGIKESEAFDYVTSRISLAGASKSMIDDAAIRSLYNSCNGSLRRLNLLMTKALILGSQLQKPVIDTELILAANNELALR